MVITILLIQLCLIHTTACYDKVFRGPLWPWTSPRRRTTAPAVSPIARFTTSSTTAPNTQKPASQRAATASGTMSPHYISFMTSTAHDSFSISYRSREPPSCHRNGWQFPTTPGDRENHTDCPRPDIAQPPAVAYGLETPPCLSSLLMDTH